MKNTHSPMKLLLPLILAGLLISCGKENMRIRGNGIIGSEVRAITAFEGVVLEGSFEVIVTPDTVTEVVVEAETNLIPFIETYVSGTALVVRNRPNTNLRPHDPMRVFVRTPYLRYGEVNGSGLLSTGQFNVNYLNLTISGSGQLESGGVVKRVYCFISGSGNIFLNGETDIAELSISGSGNINAYGMPADSAYVNISGSGNMYLNVIDLLDVRISGSGSVYYRGNPFLYTNISGSGSVIHVP
jgi:hypothetical protein